MRIASINHSSQTFFGWDCCIRAALLSTSGFGGAVPCLEDGWNWKSIDTQCYIILARKSGLEKSARKRWPEDQEYIKVSWFLTCLHDVIVYLYWLTRCKISVAKKSWTYIYGLSDKVGYWQYVLAYINWDQQMGPATFWTIIRGTIKLVQNCACSHLLAKA